MPRRCGSDERSALQFMNVPASPNVVRFFLRVLGARGWIVGAFAILTAAGIYGAARIPNDPSIERLVVAGDPIVRATAEFRSPVSRGRAGADHARRTGSLRRRGAARRRSARTGAREDSARRGAEPPRSLPSRRPPLERSVRTTPHGCAHSRPARRCSAARACWAITTSASHSSCA